MWNYVPEKTIGVAICQFDEAAVPHGLTLHLGDLVQITQICQEWYLGVNLRTPNRKGIFPCSYVQVRPTSDHERCWQYDDPVVEEATSVLREWGVIWNQLFVRRQREQCTMLRSAILDLMDWRRQLMTGTFTLDHLRDLRLRITSHIDLGNRILGLDLVPRIDDRIVGPDSVGVYQLYNVHKASAEKNRNATWNSTLPARGGKNADVARPATHHLYLSMRHFGCPLGEDAEVYFALYDMQQSRYVSEKFLVKVLKEGFSSYVGKSNNSATLFTELGNADLKRDLYLVVQVIRLGRLLYTESSKKPLNQTYRRPHAVTVLSLAELLSAEGGTAPLDIEDEEREYTLKLYQSDEKDYGLWQHELVAKKTSTSKFSLVTGQTAQELVVSLKLLRGELAALRHDHLLKSVPLTPKLGFPDVIMPGDVRNDLYVVIERGDFERGGKSSSKNVEVTVTVIDELGRTIQNCLYGASNAEGVTQHQSVVLYHMNSPVWYEMIKVSLPIEKYYGAHLRLEYRHCSTKDKTEKRLIGFSFCPLMDRDGTVLPDGQHPLIVYKVEDPIRFKDPTVSYLQMPYSTKQIHAAVALAASATIAATPSSSSFQRSSRESVTVAFYLCSTKLTQNANLLSLLKWKSHPERITDTLNLVMRLRGEELVKFLQDVLDSLFVMFSDVEGNATPHSGLVFEVLVNILSLLDDNKFQHFKSVVDAYITDHFSAALAYKGLLSCVQQCTDRVHSSSDCKHEPIQKCFKAFEILFKLVIQSRRLYCRAILDNNEEDDFRQYVQALFATFNKVVSVSSDHLVNTQVVLLHHIYTVVEQLSGILTQAEAAKLLASLVDSLPKEPHPLIATARMNLVLTTVRGPLFTESPAARAILLPTVCRQLRLHLSQPLVMSLCTETLGHMMNFYRAMSMADHTTLADNVWYRDVETVTLATLGVLIQAVQMAQKTDSNVGPLVASLLSVLELLDQGHYDRLWSELSERKPLKEFLLQLFTVLRVLARQGEQVFPCEWSTMHCVVNKVMLTALDHMTQPLVAYFLDAGWFDSQLWSNYFDLAVSFLTQPSLQLEKRTPSQRLKMVRAQGGDMRVQMGFQILTMWNAIGDYKIHFIPSMIGPFLQVTLVPELTLRRATLPIFFDMLDCEHRHRGNFKQVESELIDKLDVLVSENKGDENYKELFNTILLEKVKSRDVTWQKHGKAFIGSITRLLERLLDYRNVMEGEENRDKRMSCTFNLLNFYKDEVDRRDMYLRYIYKLHNLHLSADNYTEAALTLQLHASQLSWTNQMLPADGTHVSQMEWQRKEQLYMKSIAYFDRGKCWEKGIPLCKELAEFYETRLYDYSKLSHILRMQASFYDHILTQLRPEPEYFRVGFYGQGFPLFLRNRLFIYRGLEYERIGAFTQRLQTEFPAAQILTKNTPPGDAILTSESQHIQICNVKPVPEDHPVFDAALNFHEKIRSYYRVNDVRRFQLDRPVHKGPVDRDNEFKSLWIERTWLVTEHPLPGILRWFQVLERHVEEIPPVQYACETVLSVNRELQQLASLHLAEPRRNINPFSMRLQGVIDACVMGGIAKYQEAFFSSEFLAAQPGHLEHVLQLRQCIVDQVRILEAGLALHGKLAPPEVQPLHKRLVECLIQMKQRLKEWGFPSPDAGARYANSQGPAGLVHHHRRADSDAGIEYSTARSSSSNPLLNTSLPVVPDRVKPQRSLTAGGGPPSNRSSSSSSSLYGHLTVGEVGSEDEEDLYCKPSEILEKLQAANNMNNTAVSGSTGSAPLQPIYSTSTTPRTNAVTQASRAKSPRWANEYIFFSPASLRDSGFGTDRDSLVSNHPTSTSSTLHKTPVSNKPSPSLIQQSRHTHSTPNVHDTVDSAPGRTPPRHVAPPLPPRSAKSSFDESTGIGSDSMSSTTPPPIHPKRVPKKGPLIPSSLIMSPDALEPNTLRHHRPPPAPPLPPKFGATASPMSPTPAACCPPPIPPHRPINNSTSFSNPLDLGTGSSSLVDEVCSLLAASGCQMMSNGKRKSPSPPVSPPPPIPILPPPDERLYSGETA